MRLSAVTVLILLSAPALAQEAPRYTMTPIEGGVIRLDTQTGLISTCKLNGADLVCRGATDDRAGLQEEIDRLNKENGALKQQLATRTPALQLPDDKEVDRAFDLFDRFVRRFKGIVEDLRPDRQGEQRT